MIEEITTTKGIGKIRFYHIIAFTIGLPIMLFYYVKGCVLTTVEDASKYFGLD